MTVYKIRDVHTGKFSTGGTFPSFTSTGKTWRLGPLKTHFKLAHYNRDIEIVEYEMVQINTYTKTMLLGDS